MRAFLSQLHTHKTEVTSNSQSKLWLELLQTVGIFILVLSVLYFVVRPNVVHGISMQPNYVDGEYILTNRLPHWHGGYQRGNVVVLSSPISNELLIKRVIGLPEESISVSDGQIRIKNSQHPDGVVLEESYIKESTSTVEGNYLLEGQWYTIPNGEYIVMGDNRKNSSDSRMWGPVKRSDILGRASLVYWPVGKIHVIDTPTYGN